VVAVQSFRRSTDYISRKITKLLSYEEKHQEQHLANGVSHSQLGNASDSLQQR
jgi:hypothetical protein